MTSLHETMDEENYSGPRTIKELSCQTGLLWTQTNAMLLPREKAAYYESAITLSYIVNVELSDKAKPEELHVWAKLGNVVLRKIEKYANIKENVWLYEIHAAPFNRRMSELGIRRESA